jgi:hypothetical protein
MGLLLLLLEEDDLRRVGREQLELYAAVFADEELTF